MKKIFLIGDSIRYGLSEPQHRSMGYGYHIQEKLRDVAQVYAPDDNCRFLQYTFRYLHEWANQLGAGEDVDIVHWNNGLWDVLHLFGDDAFTPIDQYRELLVRVLKRIRFLFPRAKVYFSLNTPVIEELSDPNFTRYNREIQAYNEAAIAVLEPLGVKIIDLYTKAAEIQPDYHADWVHYTPEGAAVLADFIIAQLDL